MLRNFYRWLTKPFRKPNSAIDWQPSTPPPQRPARAKGNSLTQVVPDHHNGNSHGSLLIPTTLGIEQWGRLLPPQGAFTGHDVLGFIIGSPLRLLNLIDDFVTIQQPDTNSFALLMGATCTPGDEVALATREMTQAHWVRQAEARGMGSVYVDNPPSHRLISRKIGNIGSTGGNGGDQKKALFYLQTDPLTVPDTIDFVNDGCRSFLDYDPLGCALFTAEGGGGSHTIHSFGVSFLKSQLLVNRHYRLFLLPGDDEPLCIPNMRGTLAYALEHEASEPTPTLHLLFRQKTTGAHPTDLAMVSGIVTLSGASRGRLHGAIDATNKFNLIAKTAGTWLTIHPRVVPLPLKPMGKVFMRNGKRYEDHYEVSLPDELGGKRVTPILQELYNLVSEDPAAPHFITVASSLHQDEIEYIARGVKRFPLQDRGRIHVFYNPCWPVVSPATNMAEGLLCDFRGGAGVLGCLNDFLVDNHSTPLPTGFSQAERRALARTVDEGRLTEEIEQELNRILKTDHL